MPPALNTSGLYILQQRGVQDTSVCPLLIHLHEKTVLNCFFFLFVFLNERCKRFYLVCLLKKTKTSRPTTSYESFLSVFKGADVERVFFFCTLHLWVSMPYLLLLSQYLWGWWGTLCHNETRLFSGQVLAIGQNCLATHCDPSLITLLIPFGRQKICNFKKLEMIRTNMPVT